MHKILCKRKLLLQASKKFFFYLLQKYSGEFCKLKTSKCCQKFVRNQILLQTYEQIFMRKTLLEICVARFGKKELRTIRKNELHRLTPASNLVWKTT